MTESCAIVRDLLPSYVEGLCSEESRRFVDAHLADCAGCSGAFEAMRTQPAVPPADASEDEVLRSVRKTYRSIRIRTLALSVLCALVVFLGAAGVYSHLQQREISLPVAELDLFSMAQSPEGVLYARVGSSQYRYQRMGLRISVDSDAGALYIDVHRNGWREALSPEEAAWARAGVDVLQNPAGASRIGVMMEDGTMVYDSSGDTPVQTDRIYIRSGRDERLVWQAGEEIPALAFDPEERWAEWEEWIGQF